MYPILFASTTPVRLLLAFTLCSFTAFGQASQPLLDTSKSLVNATLPTFTTKQQLLRQLGPPTRIETADFECGLTQEQSDAKVQKKYFYGKTLFYIYGTKADLMVLDLRTGKYSYKTPRLNLTAKTTLAEVQKVYPAAVKEASVTERGTEVSLTPCAECDGRVRLYFQKGRLVELELWEPC